LVTSPTSRSDFRGALVGARSAGWGQGKRQGLDLRQRAPELCADKSGLEWALEPYDESVDSRERHRDIAIVAVELATSIRAPRRIAAARGTSVVS
jgi:hypothetical protein